MTGGVDLQCFVHVEDDSSGGRCGGDGNEEEERDSEDVRVEKPRNGVVSDMKRRRSEDRLVCVVCGKSFG